MLLKKGALKEMMKTNSIFEGGSRQNVCVCAVLWRNTAAAGGVDIKSSGTFSIDATLVWIHAEWWCEPFTWFVFDQCLQTDRHFLPHVDLINCCLLHTLACLRRDWLNACHPDTQTSFVLHCTGPRFPSEQIHAMMMMISVCVWVCVNLYVCSTYLLTSLTHSLSLAPFC